MSRDENQPTKKPAWLNFDLKMEVTLSFETPVHCDISQKKAHP
jgi:hypothetical protein